MGAAKPTGGGGMNLMNVNGVYLKDVAYTRPRQSACVIYPTPTTGALPPCPTT